MHSRLQPAVGEAHAVERVVNVLAAGRVDGDHGDVAQVCALRHHVLRYLPVYATNKYMSKIKAKIQKFNKLLVCN